MLKKKKKVHMPSYSVSKSMADIINHTLPPTHILIEPRKVTKDVYQFKWAFGILLLCKCLKQMRAYIPQMKCTRVFMAAIFPIALTWKQPKCPPEDENTVYANNEILPAVGKSELLTQFECI